MYRVTGAFIYSRYSLLLISNKFCNGGSSPHWRVGGVGEHCGKVTVPRGLFFTALQ
jgi:hypothetical protein